MDRLGLSIMSAVVVYLAGTSVVQELRTVDVETAAVALERGRQVDPSVLSRRRNDVEQFIANRTCYDLSLRAAITLSLASILRSNAADDFDRWAINVENGRNLLRQAVACSPHNGNYWALLAETERLIAATPERVMPLIYMSVRLTPAESFVLQTRFQTWPKIAPWLPQATETALGADIRVLLEQGSLFDIKRVVLSSPFLASAARQISPSLDEERRAELKRIDLNENAVTTRNPPPTRFNLLDAPRR